MRSFAIAFGLALATGSGSALAEDQMTGPDAAFDWTGRFVGAQVGHIGGKGRFFGTNFFGTEDTSYPEATGLTGGVYAGANYQFDANVVIGIEADIAGSDARGSALIYNSTGFVYPANLRVVQKLNWTGAMRARFGYAVDRWLPYVAGGMAVADVSQRLLTAAGNFNATYTGWTVGAGAEYAVTDNIVFRADYRYADFGTKAFAVPGGQPLNISLKTHSALLGVSFKF